MLVFQKGDPPPYLNVDKYHWHCQLGYDISLPNVCDCNCLTCVEDEEVWNAYYQDKRQERAKNWVFPENWFLEERWMDNTYQELCDKKDRTFTFTGRGDPLYYVPAIERILEFFNSNKIDGYTSICTSATQMDENMRDRLSDIGVEEIILNPVATYFNYGNKIEMMQKKLKVSVNFPILKVYKDRMKMSLKLFDRWNISCLIFSFVEIYSTEGLEKLESITWKEDLVDDTYDDFLILEDQGFLDDLLEEATQYNYPVMITRKTAEQEIVLCS